MCTDIALEEAMLDMQQLLKKSREVGRDFPGC